MQKNIHVCTYRMGQLGEDPYPTRQMMDRDVAIKNEVPYGQSSVSLGNPQVHACEKLTPKTNHHSVLLGHLLICPSGVPQYIHTDEGHGVP